MYIQINVSIKVSVASGLWLCYVLMLRYLYMGLEMFKIYLLAYEYEFSSSVKEIILVGDIFAPLLWLRVPH